MNRIVRNRLLRCALLVLVWTLTGCAIEFDVPFSQRISREDVEEARQNGYAIVEAQVGTGKLVDAGKRSEGYSYPIEVLSVLQPASSAILE